MSHMPKKKRIITEYDIAAVLDQMELDLLRAMKKRLTPKSGESALEWHRRQLEEIKRFRRENRAIINRYRHQVGDMSKRALRDQYITQLDSYINLIASTATGGLKSRIQRMGGITVDSLIGIDNARMVAIMQAARNDIDNKIYSLYRRTEDEYRKTIFKSTVLTNSGQCGLVEAIQVAERDYLNKGLTVCVYKNGMKMPIRSYAEMAIRTNTIRAASAARGTVQDYLGIYTVRVSQHNCSCPLCGPWQGAILIDDVYTSGKPDGKYTLMSQAIAAGYKHPNCRHTETPYDPDIDIDYGKRQYTEKDSKDYAAEQEQRRIERELRKIRRKQAGLVGASPAEQAKLQELLDHLQRNPILKRKKWREEP